jgi:hypothetical protein
MVLSKSIAAAALTGQKILKVVILDCHPCPK